MLFVSQVQVPAIRPGKNFKRQEFGAGGTRPHLSDTGGRTSF